MDLDTLARDVLDISLTAAQRTALTAITNGHDVLAVLPTGSGKSAIYQLGGLALGGLTLVVSPLMALQRDQLRSLERHGVARVAMLNSTQKSAERAAALTDLGSGRLDFLLLGPEQLANIETHRALLGSAKKITMLAVDEAHLVSEWGHDFRPEYLRLGDTIAGLGHPLIVALTATAAPPVQAEITRELDMRSPVVVVADFDRPNIALSVRRAHTYAAEELAVVDRVVEVVLAHDVPGLVYAPSHARCEDIAERLQRAGLRSAAYHAGLGVGRRAEVQDAFFAGRLDVVAATSAFGMGIDKPDVRTVVHAGVPSSIDEYYQEIGRAGRDGEPAQAVLVYDERTLRIPRLFAARTRIAPPVVQAVVGALAGHPQLTIGDLVTASQVSRRNVERVIAELAELGLLTIDDDGVRHVGALPADSVDRVDAAARRRQAILASRIDSIRHYAETVHCRRAELLAYFGEAFPPPCGNCDNDSHDTISRDANHHTHAGHTDAAVSPASSMDGPVLVDQPRPDGPLITRNDPAGNRPAPGTAVIHRLWGPGTLLSQDDHELVVAFESVGYRHLTPAALTNGLLIPVI